MEVRTYSNLELANIALGSLEELVRRGNEELDEARRRVSFFHKAKLCVFKRPRSGLDYEDRLALDD